MFRMHSIRRALWRTTGLLALCLTAGLPAQAHAQIDTLKVMIGANPGGGFDQTGRGIAAAMQSAGTIRNATFENKGGAGGAMDASAQNPPPPAA